VHEEVSPAAVAVLPYTPSSVAVARGRLRSELLAAGIYEPAVCDAAVVVSELLSNSLRHAAPLPDARVRVSWTLDHDALRIAVSDAGDGPLPHVTQPSPGEPGGRGLGIVENLADRWGVLREDGVTTVWALLTAPHQSGRPAGRVPAASAPNAMQPPAEPRT
jgi:anti-sigma regulatory factor (Ser/Thr protein kinase)